MASQRLQRVQAAQDRAATFVVITNLPTTACDAHQMLEEPTGQTVIAHRFRFVKRSGLWGCALGTQAGTVGGLGLYALAGRLGAQPHRTPGPGRPRPSTPTRGLLARATGPEV
ncbi:hypothetical protein [Sulfobacillus thermosulfidooxidans]|uniref:hypothetical protein n=1 Tax=Sulfobacillus thermosulfidooxidans TaxID=28034 RepID=UPI001111C679|nr:hypothetical protein [Sulfobacillus thermosulfidooxidans]